MDLSSLEKSLMNASVMSSGANSGSKASTLDGSGGNPSTLSSSDGRLTATSKAQNRIRGGGLETVGEAESEIDTSQEKGFVPIDLQVNMFGSYKRRESQDDELVSQLSDAFGSGKASLRRQGYEEHGVQGQGRTHWKIQG